MMSVGDRKLKLTHRIAWEVFRGPIPNGKCVCHHCDNPPCCNPNHLFIGTHADNQKDKCDKGRQSHGRDCAPKDPARGGRNGNAKLSDLQVDRIRLEYDGKYGSIKRLAKVYGVSHHQIHCIVSGKQRMSGSDEVDWVTGCDRKAKRPPRPEWVREKIRKSLKGRKRPQEVVDKIRRSRWGERQTEQRKEISPCQQVMW